VARVQALPDRISLQEKFSVIETGVRPYTRRGHFTLATYARLAVRSSREFLNRRPGAHGALYKTRSLANRGHSCFKWVACLMATPAIPTAISFISNDSCDRHRSPWRDVVCLDGMWRFSFTAPALTRHIVQKLFGNRAIGWSSLSSRVTND